MNSYPPSSTGAVVNFDPTVYDSITRTESRRRDSTERRERLQPQPPSTTRPPPSDPLPIPIPIPQHTRKSRDSRHPNDAKYIQPNVPRNSLDVYRSRLERHMSNLNLNVSISISPPEPAPPHLPKQRVRFILDGRIKYPGY
ncbi:hypothetical protein CcaverHIS631_0504020 [Cutaneotrichosporon cavernicola]|nr:hypothetical protein CcaverHIS631_0504020 [Cutaneotrichosporon cavernicola]BEJ08313.1 hypothetical protein CcaverHIS641_0503980 [Cutaneotrichosporon cavernicola]